MPSAPYTIIRVMSTATKRDTDAPLAAPLAFLGYLAMLTSLGLLIFATPQTWVPALVKYTLVAAAPLLVIGVPVLVLERFFWRR